MAHLLIFGLGYTAKRIKIVMEHRGWNVEATGSAGNLDFADQHAVKKALGRASHVLSSVPPDRASGEDPVLNAYGEALVGHTLYYLSSTGVYGDTAGAWVDETAYTVLKTGAGRRNARALADAAWLDLDACVFRLPGIYGPGRSAFDRIRAGKVRRLDIKGQVFSRIHVDDIASGIAAALINNAPTGAYNLADDLPAPGNEVTEYACRLLGIEPPPLETLEEANLSPMARGFYSENRRIANGKAKRVLDWSLQYPTFVEGLSALL